MTFKSKWKTIAAATAIIVALTGCASGSKGSNPSQVPESSSGAPSTKNAEKKIIVIDPGGDNVTYHPTKSMEKSEANPNPYNEIRILADEWEKLHPEAEIQILEQPKSRDRQQAVAMLAAGTAPDIIFQIPIFKNEDYPKGWVVPLDEYMDKPNPYIPGNTAWKDLFNKEWIDEMRSGDKQLYFTPIDAIPIGIMYNKELFQKAGIDKVPESYGDFFDAFKKLKAIGVAPYMPIYRWSDYPLETTIFASKLAEFDVLNKNNHVDEEEMVRAYTKGLFKVDSPENREYFKFKKLKAEGYPEGWSSVDAYRAFITGKVAMIEAVGGHMQSASEDKTRGFEFGIMPFPLLTENDSPFGGKGYTVRGIANYSTTWQITSSAAKKGTKDLAADFLMFLTTPENNSRLVNKRGAMVPAVSGAEPIDWLKPLYDQAQEDMKNGYLPWGAISANAAGSEYLQAYEKLSVDYLLGRMDMDRLFKELENAMKRSVTNLTNLHKYDQSKW